MMYMDGIQIWQSSKRIKMTRVQKIESWAKFRLHNCGKTGKKIPCNEITFVGCGGISDRRFHIIQLNRVVRNLLSVTRASGSILHYPSRARPSFSLTQSCGWADGKSLSPNAGVDSRVAP